jgi:hypothetical protein
MLDFHTWSKLQVLLGLTAKDIEALSHHLTTRNRQIDAENTYLQEMQAKQLEALMRIDNSELKNHSVPSMLVFRKGSVRYRRMMKEYCDRDYLLCQARDLMVARKFLSRRGLPLSYAGDWNNDFALVPSADTSQSPERLQWKMDSDLAVGPKKLVSDAVEECASEAIPSSPPMERRSTLNNRVSAWGSSSDLHVSSQSSRRCTSSYTEVEETLPFGNSRRTTGDCCLVSLKIGSENAAYMQAIEQPSLGPHRSHFITKTDVRPFQLTNTMDLSSDDTLIPSPSERAGGLMKVLPVGSAFDMPVRRKIGQWSNDTYQPKPSSITSQPRHNFGDALAEHRDDRHGNILRGFQETSQTNAIGDASFVQYTPDDFDVPNSLACTPSLPRFLQSRQPSDEQLLCLPAGFSNILTDISPIRPLETPFNRYYELPDLIPNTDEEMAEVDLRPYHTSMDITMLQPESITYEHGAFNPTESEEFSNIIMPPVVNNACSTEQILTSQEHMRDSENGNAGSQPMSMIQQDEVGRQSKDSEDHGSIKYPELRDRVTCESMHEIDEIPLQTVNSSVHDTVVQDAEELSLLSRFQAFDQLEIPSLSTVTARYHLDGRRVSLGDRNPSDDSPFSTSSSPQTIQGYAISHDPVEGYIVPETNHQQHMRFKDPMCSNAVIMHESRNLLQETMPAPGLAAPAFDLDREFLLMEEKQAVVDTSDLSARGIQIYADSEARPNGSATSYGARNSEPATSIRFHDEMNHDTVFSPSVTEHDGLSGRLKGIDKSSTEPETSIVAGNCEEIITASARPTKKAIPAKRAASASLDEQPRRSGRLNPPLERRVLRIRKSSTRK